MGVLLMLMTIGGVVAALVLLVISFVTKKAWLRNFVLGGVVVWFGFYLIALFGTSFLSKEKTLALNEPKEYCGFYLDCHMHTAVAEVQATKTVGDRTSNGEFYLVKVKVFSNAGRASLRLVDTDARVIDETGNAFARDTTAEAALGPQPEFETTVGPNGSFTKTIVFDLPSDVKQPRLDIRDGYGIDIALEAVLVDDEDSVLHRRNYFDITAAGNLAQR
jgi:hypothetical protein